MMQLERGSMLRTYRRIDHSDWRRSRTSHSTNESEATSDFMDCRQTASTLDAQACVGEMEIR